MKLVVINSPYCEKEHIIVIPAEKIQHIFFEVTGTGSQSNPYRYFIKVYFDGGVETFQFNKDEAAAKKCLNNIIEQMKGE